MKSTEKSARPASMNPKKVNPAFERRSNNAAKTAKSARPDTFGSSPMAYKASKKKTLPIIMGIITLLILGGILYFILTQTNLLQSKSTSENISEDITSNQTNIVDLQSSSKSDDGDNTAEESASIQEEDPNSPAARAKAKGLPTPPDININDWQYVLVNSEHTIDENFVPEIGIATSLSTSTEQDKRILEDMDAFIKNTEAQGLEVYLSSGYRSYETQKYLFEVKCTEYDYETAATIVAIPGTSEHQTGLCCDITDIERSPKNAELENTDTYKWMSAHCQNYGFIVRYPKNKEAITKIIYEPWHFRYVGKEAATYIMENDLCLEEFVELYV
ncbi:MAG: M15 family metallopeptidase [Eubacteriales bacterium]|nr:M15 family metallopeptidase [Eubacteriales bacterium]